MRRACLPRHVAANQHASNQREDSNDPANVRTASTRASALLDRLQRRSALWRPAPRQPASQRPRTPQSGRSASRSGGGAHRSSPAHRRHAMARKGDRRRSRRKACRSRRFRSSRAIGRPITTGAKCEAKLNALPQFITEIDGLDIHFIHVRSKHENALPLIVTHGWPGSIIEQLKIIDPLTNPTAYGGERIGRFRCGDSVDAGLRFLRQADRAPAGAPSAWAEPGQS